MPAIDGVRGEWDPRFGRVAEEFARNFSDRGELGAACAVYHEGRKVVDIWGGIAHPQRRRPWAEDTLVMMFSTTKGLAAATIAIAHSRGLIDHDEPVARLWPEFAAAGKERITVRQLLAHQAGLPALSTRIDSALIGDPDRLADALAAERPAWKPGTLHGYHALTIGWYEGELLRRADPYHRTLGRFFAEEVAEPLGLDFHIGLPAHIGGDRLARLTSRSPLELLDPRGLPRRMLLDIARPRSLTARTFSNPRLRSPAELARPEYRVLEIPAGAGIGTARSVARLYSELATGAETLGISAQSLAALSAPPQPPSKSSFDQILKLETAYSLGYIRPLPERPFASSGRAFGHPGAGGSFGFADPDAGIGFAYAPNRLGYRLADDPRERALRKAVYLSIGVRPSGR